MKDKKSIRPIDSPFYRYWQALYLSFFDSSLYVDVGKRWKGYGAVYFLLLMFILTLPISLRLMGDFNRFFNEDIVQPIKELPPLIIQNGQVSLDKPMPYLIKNKAGQVVLIVDTTGKMTSIDSTYPSLQMLITKDRLLYRFPVPQFFNSSSLPTKNLDRPIYTTIFNEYSNAVFDGEYWYKLSGLAQLAMVVSVTIYPIMAMFFFGMFVVFILAFALMGQFIARYIFKFTITYKQSCRLLFVSITPFMLVMWTTLTLNYFPTGLGLALILLISFYFSFALISFRNESNKLVNL